MFATIVSIVSICAATAGIIFGIMTQKRNTESDIEKKATEMAVLNVKLDNIGNDTRDIKDTVNNVVKDQKSFSERLVKVEESTKQAHHRIDEINEEK